MNDVVHVGGSLPDARRPDEGRVVRINRFEDVRAGTYWRAKEDVPALTRTEKRKRGVYLPPDHPDYRDSYWQSDANRIGTETYDVEVPTRSAVPSGRLHLLLKLKLVDRDIHAVVLQPHPSENQKEERTYLVDEFLHYYEMVDDDEAKAVRDAEIAALQQELADIQRRMIEGPPAEAPVALLGHQAKLPPKPGVGTMIANIGQIRSLQAAAEQAGAIAKRQADWIDVHSKEIAARTQALVPFYQERASAALASTDALMGYAKDLQRGVQSLGIYTGDGVLLKRLMEGESADPSEKLVIHRDMLYMDEEFAVNLAVEADAAGADHEDLEDFVQALTVDPKLMARVLPYPRMVVLMRYRRTAKRYVRGEGVEAALANEALNAPNFAQFLLVRDGGNLFQVWSELTTQKISALYPTKAMGDAPFRGVDGNAIGIDDLDLSEAKGKFDDLNRVYKNVLLLLWGLNDREALFGPFYGPEDWTPSGFLDEGFQARRFRFWDPYGDTTMIGEGHPRFREWIEEKNSWLRSGSRVVVRASAIARWVGRRGSTIARSQDHAVRPIDGGEAYEFVVRKTKKGHVVQIEGTRMIHPRDIDRPSYELRQTFEVQLDETDSGYDEDGTLCWICLDMVEARDIDHYLESRRDRPSYMEHHFVLLAVREGMRRDEAQLEPLVSKLEAAFADNGVDVPEGTTARLVARHAVRLWRCANRGAMPPAEGATGHAAAYKTMLGSMWTLAGNDHPVAPAETLCASEGREPLRLAMTGRDRFAVYATSVGDEVEDRLFEHVWVTRLACTRKSGRLQVTSRSVMEMPEAVADEEVLHEWPALSGWKGRTVPERLNRNKWGEKDPERVPYSHDGIRRAFAKIEAGNLDPFLSIGGDFDERLEEIKAKRLRETKGKYVADLSHAAPFAVIRRSAFERRKLEGFEARYESDAVAKDFYVLFLQDCPYRMAWRLADGQRERDRAANAFAGQYKQFRSKRMDFLATSRRPPQLGVMRLPEWASVPEDPDLRDRYWRSIPLDANWSEAVRAFDVQQIPYSRDGDPLWAPRLDKMAVWMAGDAPAKLSELCARFGWEAVPFEPKPIGDL